MSANTMKDETTATVKWVAWERYSRSRSSPLVRTIRREDEGAMKYHMRSDTPPTQEEINAEVAKRAEREAERSAEMGLRGRQDFQDATAIRNALEWLTPKSCQALDALSPEEWAELRRRICGEEQQCG